MTVLSGSYRDRGLVVIGALTRPFVSLSIGNLLCASPDAGAVAQVLRCSYLGQRKERRLRSAIAALLIKQMGRPCLTRPSDMTSPSFLCPHCPFTVSTTRVLRIVPVLKRWNVKISIWSSSLGIFCCVEQKGLDKRHFAPYNRFTMLKRGMHTGI